MKDKNLPIYILLFVIVIILIWIAITYNIHINELNRLLSERGNISITTSNDSFIGTALTIIGILVTFVIGYQIFNAVEFKKDIEHQKNELLNDYEGFKKDINEKIKENNKLLSEINILQNKIEKIKHSSELEIFILRADSAYSKTKYDEAFFNYLSALATRLYIKEETKFYNNNDITIYDIDSLNDIRHNLLITSVKLLNSYRDNSKKEDIKTSIDVLNNSFFKDNYPFLFSDMCYKTITIAFKKINIDQPLNGDNIRNAIDIIELYNEEKDTIQ